MNRETLQNQLANYLPFDPEEAEFRRRMQEFLLDTPEPFSRENLASGAEGHFTGSAFVVDSGRTEALLLWHLKLQRWLQPGGHCEPGSDTDILATAVRELREEAGPLAEGCRLALPDLFDLDIHCIPARGAEPAHFHFDIRFLFEVRTIPAIASGALRRVPLEELAGLPDSSLARMARKALRINSPAKTGW